MISTWSVLALGLCKKLVLRSGQEEAFNTLSTTWNTNGGSTTGSIVNEHWRVVR